MLESKISLGWLQDSDTFTKTPLELGLGSANCKETQKDNWMGQKSKQDLQQGSQYYSEAGNSSQFQPLSFSDLDSSQLKFNLLFSKTQI